MYILVVYKFYYLVPLAVVSDSGISAVKLTTSRQVPRQGTQKESEPQWGT